MLCLTDTENGKNYRVSDILVGEDMKKRLMELGIIKGTSIKRTQSAPSGDPVAYLVRGTEIALRCEYAGKITVSEI